MLPSPSDHAPTGASSSARAPQRAVAVMKYPLRNPFEPDAAECLLPKLEYSQSPEPNDTLHNLIYQKLGDLYAV